MFRASSGAVIDGRYQLERVIGWGSLAEIWRAHDLGLDAPCAVKLLLGHLATDEGARARLQGEARALALLRCAHTVQVLAAGEHDGAVYLVLELLHGETLASRLQRTQTLSPAATLALLEQVADVLEKAHAAGIVHRDLKPDNLWLCAHHPLFVKVLDFALAQLQPQPWRPARGALVGTPGYMAPEQALADREVDHRADLWSLAVVAGECLTGKRPFEANGTAARLLALASEPPPPLAALGPQLPAALEAWWQRALQRDPALRFQSARQLLEALESGLGAAHGSAAAAD